MQRTIRIHLQPSPAQAAALAETSRQFTAAFNLFVEMGWRACVSNATKLHFLAYYPVRTALPDLNSNLTNTARAKAAEALRSAFTLRKDRDRKVSQPHSDACPPRYNVHTYRVDWESQTVRLSLVGGRQTIRFRVPAYAAKYAGNPVDTTDLIHRNGERMQAKRRSQTKRCLHAWPFARLKAKIAYKAEERGCTVVAVDPRHTSQACSRCGHTARNNRRSQSVFTCRKCGLHLNADLNGARNIAAKYRAGGGRSPAGGLCNQPIVSTPDSFGREEQAAGFMVFYF